MRNTYIIFIVIVLTFVSCASVKQTAVLSPDLALPSETQFSNNFKLFWAEFVQDLKDSGTKVVAKYKPSQKFAESPYLSKEGARYVINGFLHTAENSGVELAAPKGSHIEIRKKTATIYTFRCPVNEVDKLIAIDGVRYVELGQRANLVK